MSDERREILRDVMERSGTSQVALARLSGVHQPSISQFLTGRIEFSDEQVDRLLNCMGSRLEVVRRSVVPDLTRREWRSWALHRAVAGRLTKRSLLQWLPTIESNLLRLSGQVTGQPHERNLQRWRSLVADGDVSGIKKALVGLDRHSVEMREVAPMGGILAEDERREILMQVA